MRPKAMTQNRREFLERLGAGAMLATPPLWPMSGDVLRAFATPLTTGIAAEDWDLSWTSKVNGKYRAVFDVPEIDSAYGVWRASLWVQQYMEVLKAGARDCSPVLVLRHKGIALAMTQKFWNTRSEEHTSEL